MTAPLTPTIRRVMAARTAMLLDDPFFGSLALRLRAVEDPTARTAWTDGDSLAFNPAWAAKLDADQLKAVIAHEVMHCAGGHPWRRDGRQMERWNIAGDYAINGLLAEAGYKLPAEGLMPDADQKGKSAEWIYGRLPEPPKCEDGEKKGGKGSGKGAEQTKPQPGSDPGDMGEVRDAPTAEDAPTEAEWKQATQQAAQQAKRAGKLPASLARHCADAVRPRVDWRAELRALLERARADYTWQRPNPRFTHLGIYMPTVDAPEMPPLAIAVDTSGSMDDVTLGAARAELEAIIAETQPTAAHVLYADAKVAGADLFDRGEPVQWRPSGGGGTDFRPVCRAVDHLDPAPAALIYITDLAGRMPPEAPETPVFWLTTSADPAPFGVTIRIED